MLFIPEEGSSCVKACFITDLFQSVYDIRLVRAFEKFQHQTPVFRHHDQLGHCIF
jgi:hypothetical protein